MKPVPKDMVVVSVPCGAIFKPIGLHAMEMSTWLTDQGLVWGKDYDWHIDRLLNVTRFRFHNTATEYASLFILRWVNNEIH